MEEKLRKIIIKTLKKDPQSELISIYLIFLEHTSEIHPVLSVKDKTIYRNEEEALRVLQEKNMVWTKTEIKILPEDDAVNSETTKVYICPFSGKVFGNNTHPNPQDAIYHWVMNCPENQEMDRGMRVKRFYVSEDPEVIESYKQNHKDQPTVRSVYSSAMSGKLFNSIEAVIEEYKKTAFSHLSLCEVYHQDRFDIEANFFASLQEELAEEKISEFVALLTQDKEIESLIQYWFEGEKEEEKEETL